MIVTGLENILNDTAEKIDGDDLIDGVSHFAKKNKTDEEKAKIDERSEDFKAAGKIAKGGLKGLMLLLGLVATVKFLTKK
jgi:hypothetical protein